jgi:hypothetical protein
MQFSKMDEDVFTSCTFKVVGDGKSALFSKDRWMDGW